MTRSTSLGLDRQVLVEERSLFIAMAVEADLFLTCGGAQRAPRQISAVRVMAVGAGDQLLINSVPVGLCEIGPGFRVAAVTKRRLIVDQERVLLVSVVRRMAVDATDAVLEVCRPAEVAVLLAGLMARQTTAADDIRPLTLEDEYLTLIASAIDVRLAGTVARFATVHFSPADLQGRVPMRVSLEVINDIFVASLAGIATHVLRGIPSSRRHGTGLLVALSESRLARKRRDND